MEEASVRHLLEPLSDLQKMMRKCKCLWMVIGGMAASLLGKPRFTADVDIVILINDEDILHILELAEQFGFKARPKNPVEFAKKNRVLLLRHEKSGINVDISLGFLPFEKQAIKRSQPYKIGGLTFNLPMAEDLIILKAVAHRPQDVIDIKDIVDSNPKINVKYIKKIVGEFAKVLEMPEILTDIRPILNKIRS